MSQVTIYLNGWTACGCHHQEPSWSLGTWFQIQGPWVLVSWRYSHSCLPLFPSLITGPWTSCFFFNTLSQVAQAILKLCSEGWPWVPAPLSPPPNYRVSGMRWLPGFQRLFLRFPSEISALCVLGVEVQMHVYPGDSQESLEVVYVSREKEFSEEGEEMLAETEAHLEGLPSCFCLCYSPEVLSRSVQRSVVHGGGVCRGGACKHILGLMHWWFSSWFGLLGCGYDLMLRGDSRSPQCRAGRWAWERKLTSVGSQGSGHLGVSGIWYGISLVYFQKTEHSLALPHSGWHLLLGFHPLSHLGRVTFPGMLTGSPG